MKALEEEYEALQRIVWRGPNYVPKDKQADQAPKVDAVLRMREIRKEIGDDRARAIVRRLLHC